MKGTEEKCKVHSVLPDRFEKITTYPGHPSLRGSAGLFFGGLQPAPEWNGWCADADVIQVLEVGVVAELEPDGQGDAVGAGCGRGEGEGEGRVAERRRVDLGEVLNAVNEESEVGRGGSGGVGQPEGDRVGSSWSDCQGLREGTVAANRAEEGRVGAAVDESGVNACEAGVAALDPGGKGACLKATVDDQVVLDHVGVGVGAAYMDARVREGRIPSHTQVTHRSHTQVTHVRVRVRDTQSRMTNDGVNLGTLRGTLPRMNPKTLEHPGTLRGTPWNTLEHPGTLRGT